jgi:hypothetical protein
MATDTLTEEQFRMGQDPYEAQVGETETVPFPSTDQRTAFVTPAPAPTPYAGAGGQEPDPMRFFEHPGFPGEFDPEVVKASENEYYQNFAKEYQNKNFTDIKSYIEWADSLPGLNEASARFAQKIVKQFAPEHIKAEMTRKMTERATEEAFRGATSRAEKATKETGVKYIPRFQEGKWEAVDEPKLMEIEQRRKDEAEARKDIESKRNIDQLAARVRIIDRELEGLAKSKKKLEDNPSSEKQYKAGMAVIDAQIKRAIAMKRSLEEETDRIVLGDGKAAPKTTLDVEITLPDGRKQIRRVPLARVQQEIEAQGGLPANMRIINEPQ